MIKTSETATITGPLVKALRGIPGVIVHRLHSGKTKVRGGYMQHEEAGTPDVLALLPCAGFSDERTVLYLETKAKDGVVNAEQKKRHRYLKQLGFRVEVPRSFADGMRIVREILGGKEGA